MRGHRAPEIRSGWETGSRPGRAEKWGPGPEHASGIRRRYAGIEIFGFITLPELVGTVATVTVPFFVEGFFYTPESFWSSRRDRIEVFGQGTVTVTFLRTEEPGFFPYWRFGGAIYTLQDPNAPQFNFTGLFSPVDNDPNINAPSVDESTYVWKTGIQVTAHQEQRRRLSCD